MKLVDSLLSLRAERPAIPLRQQVKQTLATALHAAGVMRLSLRLLRRIDPTRRLVVLIYHKVVPASVSGALEGVASENLESQVRVVRELFECLPADEATQALDQTSPVGDRYPALFTFDDGYHNNLQYALPILSAWNVPSIVFAPTALVGTQTFLWTDEVTELILRSPRSELRLQIGEQVESFRLGDRRSRLAVASTLKRRFKRLPYHELQAALELLRGSANVETLHHHEGTRLLSWSSLQRLPNYGAVVGSHSSRHMILSNLPKDVLDDDLAASQRELQERLGASTRYIAYPNGRPEDINEQVFTSARKTGFIYGFTMKPGIATQHDDAMQLPRIAVKDEPGPMVALDVLRRLASDVIHQQLRLLHRSDSERSAPPRLVVVPGEKTDTEVEKRPRIAFRPKWSSSKDEQPGESTSPGEVESA
jgi:peptidoglycan/xylan/chitin deacetylase (PgdA/CDA1 family)